MEFHAAGPWRSKWGLKWGSLEPAQVSRADLVLDLVQVCLVPGHDSES